MMDHLTESVREFASQDIESRKQFIKGNKWIGYSKAIDVLTSLEELVVAPRTTRMPNILLVGSSNNGKTVIIDRFSKQYPLHMDEKSEELRQKVLMVEAPPSPDESRFYQQILRKLVIPFRSNHKPEVLFDQVVNAFQRLQLKVLIIDEIHHLLHGHATKKQVFLNSIKSLSNVLSLSIVAVGTKEAFYVFQSDPQMSSRFETIPLEKWKLDKEYIRFLVSYEKILPLRERSYLHEKELAVKILSLTDNTIGGITTVLKKAAIHAIENGEEKITISGLDKIGIVHPSEQRKMPMI